MWDQRAVGQARLEAESLSEIADSSKKRSLLLGPLFGLS